MSSMGPIPAVKRFSHSIIRSSRALAFPSRRNPLLHAQYAPLLYTLSGRPYLVPYVRVFATTPRHRKDEARIRTVQQETAQVKEVKESIKPETLQKEQSADASSATSKQDALLTEQTVSNKEQRKADWAIIRQMGKYLWPKDNLGTRFRVGLSVGLLVGAKVRIRISPISICQTHRLCRYSMYKCHSTLSPSLTA